MNNTKTPARQIHIRKVPNNMTAHTVSYVSKGKTHTLRFNSKNNARSYVNRNLRSCGHYA